VAKRLLKSLLQGVSLLLVLPAALFCGFGRWEAFFGMFAQGYATVPGLVGDYLRIAFYKLTLTNCSLESRVSFGSFFAHSQARVGASVYIGSYCILGKTSIGDRTQIASGVQILSGSRQHGRDESGQIQGADHGQFSAVSIGSDCWIGAAAIVMADVGEGSTIGAGSVVSRAIPARSVAVGSPARVIKSAQE
jgi:acetyltransferase-like isoleucine patch superfamily enzyme